MKTLLALLTLLLAAAASAAPPAHAAASSAPWADPSCELVLLPVMLEDGTTTMAYVPLPKPQPPIELVLVPVLLTDGTTTMAMVPWPTPQPPIGERQPGSMDVIASSRAYRLYAGGEGGSCEIVRSTDDEIIAASCMLGSLTTVELDRRGCRQVTWPGECAALD